MNRCLKKAPAIFFVGAFLFLCVFFTQVHPLVIYDGDDWTYIAYTRQALPSWREWNPSRVFAECFEPLVGFLAAYGVTPLLGDYLHALTVTSAFALSLMIMGYLWMLARLLVRQDGSWYRACFVTVIFLLFHFLLMKVHREGNPYLFWSVNFNCIYYYVMPALLNASLVLFLMREGRLTEVFQRLTPVRSGWMAFWIYFAIFSSIFHSIILASYLGLSSLRDARAEAAAGNFHLRNFLRRHRAEAVVLGFWLLSLLFEANGGRARQIGQSLFDLHWEAVLPSLAAIFGTLNVPIIGGGLLLIVAMAWDFYRGKQGMESEDQMDAAHVQISLAAMAVTFLYLFLVCLKTGPSYLARSDVMVSGFFFLLLAICIALHALARRHAAVVRAIPIAVFIVLIATVNPNRGFLDSTPYGVPARVCDEVDHDILGQILAADQAGVDTMTLHVPVSGAEDNWPHPYFLKNRLRNTLYRHGIITRTFDIQVVPDAAMNRKYHLPLPDGEAPQEERQSESS